MVSTLELNRERYISLLSRLIGESEFLQNNPPNYIPQEDRAVKHLLEVLRPHSQECSGPLRVEHISYVEQRGNLMVEYSPDGAKGHIAIMGSHLDVVPANPLTWNWDPFKLTIEGDRLYGRGTTDCLGHVALLTELMLQLAEKKPPLRFTVTAIFIASEENPTIPNVGADMLLKQGRLDRFKQGAVYWLDSCETHPRIGTAAVMIWSLKVIGKRAHSSLPHRGINSLELAMDAVEYIQKRFYQDFPPHPGEKDYNFATPSTMKPTQVCCAEGNVNEIPDWTKVKGDVRLTPFYSIEECKTKLQGYIEEFKKKLDQLCRGPSKYKASASKESGECVAHLELTFEGQAFKGVACDLQSRAFQYLHEATKEVIGESLPFSICGAMPLVGDLKEAGYNIQMCGYGHSSVYHGDNEYCTFGCMANGLKILGRVLDKYNASYEEIFGH